MSLNRSSFFSHCFGVSPQNNEKWNKWNNMFLMFFNENADSHVQQRMHNTLVTVSVAKDHF
jgi:hypothetical protein